jgi:hypothetical protein
MAGWRDAGLKPACRPWVKAEAAELPYFDSGPARRRHRRWQFTGKNRHYAYPPPCR